MQSFSATPKEMVASLWRNRELIRALIKREVLGRYSGSFLGILWSFFNPMFMLAVYTFVFSVVFKAKWGSGGESKTEFALVLFAGLLIFNLFAECVNRAPELVVSNVNYVKKMVFPLEVLPWVTLGGALFHASISLIVWLVAYVIIFGAPHLTIIFLPMILLPLTLFIMGASWILASLGVFLRDISQLIGAVVMVVMFLSPVFYPASALSPDFQRILMLNPMSPAIEMVRDVLYWGRMPDFALLSKGLIMALIFSWAGFFWFQKTRKGFADVL